MMVRTWMVVLGLQGVALGQGVGLFAVLDRLGAPDGSQYPCICVLHRGEAGEWRRYGFQMGHDGKTADVQWLTLQREKVRLDRPERDGSGRLARRTIAPVDMRTLVPILTKNLSVDVPFGQAGLVGAMRGAGEAIVLARALAKNGYREESERLLHKVPDAQRQLARGLARRVALDRTDPRYSWRDLLDRHNAWLAAFDDTTGAVKAARDQIQRIVKERQGSDMSPVRRALLDELWLDSNDLVDHSMVKPPTPPPTDGTRPLDRIRALGIDAIPQLIELLDDKTPTRACSHTERFGGVLRPCSVGNQANAVLSHLSGIPWQFVPQERLNYLWIEWYGGLHDRDR